MFAAVSVTRATNKMCISWSSISVAVDPSSCLQQEKLIALRPVLTAFYVLTFRTPEYVRTRVFRVRRSLQLQNPDVGTPSTDFSPVEGDSFRPLPTDGQNSKSPRSQNFESCWKVWLLKKAVRYVLL